MLIDAGVYGKENYYIHNGEVVQKVTVVLPLDLVEKLKIEAIKARVTLSHIIRKRLGRGNKYR